MDFFSLPRVVQKERRQTEKLVKNTAKTETRTHSSVCIFCVASLKFRREANKKGTKNYFCTECMNRVRSIPLLNVNCLEVVLQQQHKVCKKQLCVYASDRKHTNIPEVHAD